MFGIGIVGLPNVGKSTLFNAITRARVEAANYPFATIDRNVGVVAVPDPRLDALARVFTKGDRVPPIVPTTVEFVDIAGLVSGAHRGEGLGNQFLGHIREVAAIAHVVRCFDDPNVIHVGGRIDPIADVDTIETELLLADLATLERRAERLRRGAKGGHGEEAETLAQVEALQRALSSGVQARATGLARPDDLRLLTDKPVVFVCNVSESDVAAGNAYVERVRERAAMAIGRRKTFPAEPLIKLLEDPALEARIGGCQAIAQLRGRAAKAVPKLRETLHSDHLWLRVKAADALAAIGQPAMVAVPELLERLAVGPTEDDPRGMEQRYLSFAVFNRRGGLLGNSLEGVDRDLLVTAVRAGLRNQDGRARGSFTSVYHNLSFKEIEPLLPAIHEAIISPAPSGIMFCDQIQTAGLELFARHHVSEGIELLARYLQNQKPHGSQKRITTILALLESYGSHAQRAIPLLEEAVSYFENEERNFPRRLSLQKAEETSAAIAEIKAATDRPKLITLDLGS